MKELTEVLTIEVTTVYKDERDIDYMLDPVLKDQREANAVLAASGHFTNADDIQATAHQFLMVKDEDGKPRIGGEYYYVNATGKVEKAYWHDMHVDNALLIQGNCFSTEAEALAASISIRDLLMDMKDL